jgi:hypothetical protein
LPASVSKTTAEANKMIFMISPKIPAGKRSLS